MLDVRPDVFRLDSGKGQTREMHSGHDYLLRYGRSATATTATDMATTAAVSATTARAVIEMTPNTRTMVSGSIEPSERFAGRSVGLAYLLISPRLSIVNLFLFRLEFEREVRFTETVAVTGNRDMLSVLFPLECQKEIAGVARHYPVAYEPCTDQVLNHLQRGFGRVPILRKTYPNATRFQVSPHPFPGLLTHVPAGLRHPAQRRKQWQSDLPVGS